MQEIHYEITAGNSGFVRRIREIRSDIDRTVTTVRLAGQDMTSVFANLEGGLHRLAKAGAAAFTFAEAGQFARDCVNVRAEMQSLEISFETLLGNKEKADAMLGEIKNFAATTPMDMDTLAKGAQTMLSFNISAEKVMPMLRSIGDISMGNTQKFESLTLAFSQMSSTGKLMGQDLLQMINAGFNPLAEISSKTGKSISTLKKEMEGGLISVNDVTDALTSATSEGGKFHNMLEKQAEGLKGSFAYLRGSISNMMNGIGESMEEPVSKGVTLAGDLVKNYEEVGKAIGVLVGMYGAYKTAVMVNAAVDLDTIGRLRKLAVAKQALIAIQTKLNAAMAVNPYGIAAAAVVALGYAIYKLFTYQSDYQKSLERVTVATEEARIAGDKEINTLDQLKAKLDVAEKGSAEWKAAKDAIVKQYSQYIPQLDEEITKVGNLSTAYRDLVIAIQEANAAKGLQKFIDDNDNSEEVSIKFREGLKDFRSSTGKLNEKERAYFENILRQYAVNSSSDQDVFSFVQDKLKEKFGVDAGSQIYSGYEYFLKHADLKKINEAHQMNRSREMEYDLYRQDMGISESTYNKVRYGIDVKPEETSTRDGSEIDKDIKAKKSELSQYKKDSQEYKNLIKEINALEKERAEWGDESDLKAKKGATPEQIASKQAESHQKLLDLMKQQAEERLKQEQDYEYQRWQNRIDLMQEGEAKVIAQMQLDQAKEKTSLEEQKQQAIQAEIERQKTVFDAREDKNAAGNKKYAKQVFNPSTDVDQAELKAITQRYDNLYTQLLSKQKKAEQDRLRQAQESFNAYLQEFGNYQQKREAISADYDKRISEAANTGDRMMLEAQKNKALSELDYQQWIDSGEIALAFKDIERYSSNTVRKLIADMEKYRSKIIATFDPDKIEKYEEALRRLRKLDADQSFGIFSNFVPDYFKKKAAAAKELKDAEDNMNAIYEERSRLMNELLSLQKDIVDEVKKQTGTDISMSDALDIDKLKSIIEQINALGGDSSKLQGMTNKLPQLQNGIQQSGEAAQVAQQSFMGLSEAFAGSFSGGADAIAWIDTIVHGINDLVQGINNTFKELSSTAEALGADMSEGSNWSQAGIIMQGFADASQGATDAWDSLKSGNIMGVVQGVVKSFTSWIKAFAAFSDAKHERKIQQIQERIESLQKSYDKLGKAVEKAYSTDASHMIEQQNTMLKHQQALIRMQIAEEEAKKKTDKEKIKEWKDQLDEINETLKDNEDKAKEAIIGKDIKSAIDEFSSAYAEAWGNGTDAAQASAKAVKSIISSALSELLKKNIQPTAQKFYDTLAKAMEDGILTDAELANLDAIKRQMDAIAASGEEQYKKIQERYKDLDELREELTDISFDSVRDNFKSLLSDMESTTEDFTNSFTDMLRNALIEGLMDNKYDAMLKEWYEDFAEAMKDQSLSDTERDALRQQYDAIVQQGIADRNAVNAIVGGGAYSQQASEGSAWNINQETGDELNGRFTAMVELEATNNLLVSDGNAIARDILATLRSLSGLSMTVTGNGDNETLLAIKDMIFLSTGYLENIEKHSKNLASMATDISEMKTAIKNL